MRTRSKTGQTHRSGQAQGPAPTIMCGRGRPLCLPYHIEIKNLSKTFDQKLHILQDINLQIKKGEIFGVIGKSGAGKSTLIRCVNLLETPTCGKVYIDDVEITSLSSQMLRKERRRIAMIFQHFNLLNSRTVYENIALPLELEGRSPASYRQKIQTLLDLIGLADKRDAYPDQLSGGQKQRVAIARALITDPKVLLCDEPTSSLDPESTAAILQLLKKVNAELKITLLLITHEMEVIKNICDRVAVLDQGKVVEQGEVIPIFTAPQADITKRLTQSALHLELPGYLRAKLRSEQRVGTHPVVQLTFIGSSANEPVIAALLKRFNVTVSILQADLETIHEAAVGFLICKLMGTEEATASALAYLNTLKIKTEVLGYA